MGDFNQPLTNCDLLNCEPYIFVLKFTAVQNYSVRDVDILFICFLSLVPYLTTTAFSSAQNILLGCYDDWCIIDKEFCRTLLSYTLTR
jgi:hypothetical protein